MSIKETQVLDRDTLNRAFVSKGATGTQIMAGSLRLLGGLTVDGATTFGTLTTGALTTTSTITAGTFSGSGASLTNLPAGNLTGSVADARLSANVVLLNKVQTFTANNTYSSAANLFFAGGTTYKIDTAGSANFNALSAAGNITTSGQVYARNLYLGQGATEGDIYNVNIIDGNGDIIFQPGTTTKHYMTDAGLQLGGGTAAPQAMLDVRGSGQLTGNLDVQGEFTAAGGNEFPDPFLASKSVSEWIVGNGTGSIDNVQAPSQTSAKSSLKLVASAPINYAAYKKVFKTTPGEWVTFSAYLFSTVTGKAAKVNINWKKADGSNSAVTPFSIGSVSAPTAWARFSVTGVAPSDAASFSVEVHNDGDAGVTMYYSSFQVERSRTLTRFKAYAGGGDAASFTAASVKLGASGEIQSSYNDNYLLKDHNNGNVSLNAAGGTLYLGYQNTTQALLYANLYTANGASPIASTTGTLYYQGNDIDNRYLKLSTGGTVAGDILIDKNNPWLTLDSASTGGSGVEQAAGISIGESGYKGTAALHFTYTGDGQSHIGMGVVDPLTGIPENKAIGLNYTDKLVRFYDTPQVSGNAMWHAGNDGADSGLDADTVDGLQATSFMRTDANTSTTGMLSLGTGNVSRLVNQTTGALRHLNDSGYIDIGPQSASFAHIYTDRPSFYFNKDLYVNGSLVVLSTRTLTAGTGLTGGGTLAANRTLAVDSAWLNTYGDGRWVSKAGDAMTGLLNVSVAGGGVTTRINLSLDNDNAGSGGAIQFATSTSAGYGAKIFAERTLGGNGDLFLATGGNNPQKRITILNDGNVGIGNTAPTQALEVTGNIRADQLYIGATRKDLLWDAANSHIASTGADHSFINQSVTTAASPQFNELSLASNHYTNKFIGNIGTATQDALIILCRADDSGVTNHVAGKLYGRRVSGNTHALIIDVLVNSTSTAGSVQVSGFVNTMAVQFTDAVSLVTLTYGGVAYTAVRIQQGLNQELSNGLWFSGQCASSGPEQFRVIAAADATNIIAVASYHTPRNTFGAGINWPGGDSDKANTAFAHTSLTNNPHNVTVSQIGAVPTARSISTGTGITGGGDLSANRTLAFDATWGDGRYALSGHNHNGSYLGTGTPSSLDVNSLTNGTNLYTGSTGGWANRGPSGHNGSSLFSMNTHAGSFYSQLWFDTGGDSFYHRSIDNGTIRAWRKVWTEGNFTPGNYSLTTHNHDSAYLKLTGGTIAGNLSVAAGATVNPAADSTTLLLGRQAGQSSIRSTDPYLMLDSGIAALGLNWYTDAPIIIGRMAGSKTGIGTDAPLAKFHVDNSTNTMSGFYVNTGLTPGTQTLFEHKLNSVATPYRIQKSAYVGSSSLNGILNLHLNASTAATGINLFFTGNSSTGVERQYGGIGAQIDVNTNAAENGSLLFHTMSGGALLTRMTLSSSGNLGIGTTPHGSYKLRVNGDTIIESGWLRVGGQQGIIFNDYGGGFNMTDSTWIRIFGNKGLYLGTNILRTDGTLQVGNSGATLNVVQGGSLTFRDALYADATRVGIGMTAPEHPLHIKTSTTHLGVNVQGSSDALTYGYSLENAGGTYSWLMARNGTNTSPDLVFYGGSSTALTSLSERLRIKNSGNVLLTGTLEFPDADGYLISPSPNWGLHWNTASNILGFKGAAVDRFTVDLDTGDTTMSGRLDVAGAASTGGSLTADKLHVMSGDGKGLHLWNSAAYSIYMATTANASLGGRMASAATSDYNMYFKMTGATNRGWVFLGTTAGTTPVAQIEGSGKVHAAGGYRTGNFEIVHNATEDSLDFVYAG